MFLPSPTYWKHGKIEEILDSSPDSCFTKQIGAMLGAGRFFLS